jgi:membrane-bound metal-dependent hydrolase YbcI (DUF457 family)
LGGDSITGPTHITFSFLATAIHWKVTGEFSLDGIIIGALFPDIDDTDSIIGKCCPLISKPIGWIQKGTRFIDHRMLTHSLVPLGALFTYYTFHPYRLLFGFMEGWISHIAADLLNDRGVALLYPLSDFRIRLASITTGKVWESRINLLVWWVILAMFVPNQYWIQISDSILYIIERVREGIGYGR